MNRIPVFDGLGRRVFQIIPPEGWVLWNGRRVNPNKPVHLEEGGTVDLHLSEIRRARGLSGERITYYSLAYGGDLIRFVETATGSWWEVVRSRFDLEGNAVQSIDEYVEAA